jgi:hypothetical protein
MPVAMGEARVINLLEAFKIVLDQGVERRSFRIMSAADQEGAISTNQWSQATMAEGR